MRGICSHGAFTFDIEWDAHRTRKICVHAQKGGRLSLEIGTKHGRFRASHDFYCGGEAYVFEGLRENEKIEICLE